ncbi:MAG: hypothetical protein ACR2PB_15270 [Desulfocapsaceae bacterium]
MSRLIIGEQWEPGWNCSLASNRLPSDYAAMTNIFLLNRGNLTMPLTLKRLFLVIGILITHLMSNGAAQAQNTEIYSPELLAMQGRWVRTDAPYIIEIRQNENNKLQASYFNPRPIHVDKTETAKKDGLQYVMIKLQDVNYEGSVYLLNYDREQDALQGIYMHGGSGQRFKVSFSRQTSP